MKPAFGAVFHPGGRAVLECVGTIECVCSWNAAMIPVLYAKRLLQPTSLFFVSLNMESCDPVNLQRGRRTIKVIIVPAAKVEPLQYTVYTLYNSSRVN